MNRINTICGPKDDEPDKLDPPPLLCYCGPEDDIGPDGPDGEGGV